MTDLTFANLVDTNQIRELLEAHYKITGIGAAILDTDENILVAVGYHDICTRFHLAHPVAKLYCRESDAYIKVLTAAGQNYADRIPACGAKIAPDPSINRKPNHGKR